ncbi:MAG: winged helix-turn-helix transcriptional regulator, partial [Clostridiaceae bacterium]|nr:winged helix-turn-helix transcriptional regulator [Clostridiaceae bacterium]
AIESLLEVPLEDFFYTFFNGEVGLKLIKSKKGLSKDQLEIVLQGDYYRRELIACLKSYYYIYFEKELRFIEPLLIRNMRKQIGIMEKIGLEAFITTIHNRIEITPSSFVLHKYVDFIAPFDGLKKIDIRISSFIDPHLLISMSEGTLQFTLRAHLLENVDELPLDLYNTMKALGDDTRLKILKSIYKGKASTQSLAKQLELTEACISKHLKLMFEADILYKKREGNYIYYLLNRIVLDRIPMDMYQYLDG